MLNIPWPQFVHKVWWKNRPISDFEKNSIVNQIFYPH
jgi:hypothetical protein